ncbi:MAG TPA: hypothetical protein VFN95_13115 [Flavitalea sp.]|nr:hypothetical protein [Flavitalea sp.]
MADIFQDLKAYLDSISEDSNQDLFDKYLSKWKDVVVPTGLGIIVDRMRQYGDDLAMRRSLGDPQTQDLLLSNGMMLLAGMQDAIVATGKNGYKRLLDSLSHSDEDVGSVAALELASKELGKTEAIPYLEKSQAKAKRTGFQVAISIALGRQNKYTLYGKLARKYVIRDDMQYKFLAESAVKAYDDLSASGALRRLRADGEYVYNSREEAINGSIFALSYQTAMSLVVLSISSRGKIPRNFFSDWT